ncbi:hypothetical protein BJV78DRAFT_1188356 [Lactifluus subvellereus]|nr:hypothetical protein BJV78DRAFT_1188356 [Lactifluus subvellereus]
MFYKGMYCTKARYKWQLEVAAGALVIFIVRLVIASCEGSPFCIWPSASFEGSPSVSDGFTIGSYCSSQIFVFKTHRHTCSSQLYGKYSKHVKCTCAGRGKFGS